MQKPLNTGNKCINPKCKTQQDEKLIRPIFAPIDQLCEILGTNPTAHQAFVLCRKCYNETYSIVFELHKPCSSCGAIPKASTVFNRHSPNAEAVTQHLKTAGHNATISPTDCLCFGCYKMHCAIMETLKSEGKCQGCVNLPVDEACELDDSSDASGNESGSESNENTEEDAEELQMEIITDDF